MQKITRNTDEDIKELLTWYQKEASKTFKSMTTPKDTIAHLFLGVCTEWGELLDIYKKNVAYGKDIDIINLHEEWADGMFYLVNYANLFPNEMELTKPFSIDLLDERLTGFTEEGKKDNSRVTGVDVAIGFGCVVNFAHFQYMYEYWFEMANVMEIDVEKALRNNIDKLKVRYPEGFKESNALNRNLDDERRELEK